MQRVLALCWAMILAATGYSQSSENLFDFKHGLSFARFLEDHQHFDLAIDEYERLDALSPGDLEVRMALLRLFALNDKPEIGIHAFEKWNYRPAQPPVELSRKYVGLFFQNRAFELLHHRLDNGFALREPDKTRVRLQLALYEKEWGQAQKLFETFEIQHVTKHRQTYEPILKAVDRLQYRKPWLGAGLSLVPGAGQVYAGQWVDGLSSLLLVGITGFEAYRLMHKRGPKNLLAWGLAGLSFSFYIANIYGGQRAVKRFNERQDAGFRQILDGVSVRDF